MEMELKNMEIRETSPRRKMFAGMNMMRLEKPTVDNQGLTKRVSDKATESDIPALAVLNREV
jgi:hypothetical protein